ncbi:MAG: hypothetical protein JWN30_331 [Bacilli bacterium]|nr:hypothetical protein [Bacilli bacterium]
MKQLTTLLNKKLIVAFVFPLYALGTLSLYLPQFDQPQHWDILSVYVVLSLAASFVSVRTTNSALNLNGAVILSGLVLYGTWVSVWSAIIGVLLNAFMYNSRIINSGINAGQKFMSIMVTGLLQYYMSQFHVAWVISDILLIIFFWISSAVICAVSISGFHNVPYKKAFEGMVKGSTATYLMIAIMGLIAARLYESFGIVSLVPIFVCYLILSKVFKEYFTSVKKLEDNVKEVKHLNTTLITTMAYAIDARDPYTSGHSWRVAHWAKEIARTIKLPQKNIDDVYFAGILHDIGKIGIEDAILRKEGKLTFEEYERIKDHPVIGYQILKQANVFPELLPGIRSHHERIDGKGYPDELKGEEIPLMARILAVSDAFDAMVSDRPYRKGLPIEEALSRVKEGMGTQFDAELAAVFTTLIENLSDADVQEMYQVNKAQFEAAAGSE